MKCTRGKAETEESAFLAEVRRAPLGLLTEIEIQG